MTCTRMIGLAYGRVLYGYGAERCEAAEVNHAGHGVQSMTQRKKTGMVSLNPPVAVDVSARDTCRKKEGCDEENR